MNMADGDLENQARLVRSRPELAKFVDRLAEDCARRHAQWDNDDLVSFLNGLAGFLLDAPGYYTNNNEASIAEQASWRLFADALLAARVYDND